MYRVLRPGGTLLIGEFQTSRGRRWSRLHHFWAGETIEQARELTGCAAFTNIQYADINPLVSNDYRRQTSQRNSAQDALRLRMTARGRTLG
jgi:ubiquinone/menaquinone biosynthesis C-methylase UbiE